MGVRLEEFEEFEESRKNGMSDTPFEEFEVPKKRDVVYSIWKVSHRSETLTKTRLNFTKSINKMIPPDF